MAGDPPPKPAHAGASMGWTALGYLMGGIAVWGFLGWLVDEWLNVPKHLGLLVGMLLGTAGAMYLIVKRLDT